MSSELGQPVADMANRLRKMQLDTQRAAQTKAINKAQARAIAISRRTGRRVIVVKGM